MSEAIWTMPKVDNGNDFVRSTSATAAGTAGIVIIGSKSGRFYRGFFKNSAATNYWLQIFDKATAPVNTDVPIWEKNLPSSGEVEIDLVNVNGLYFSLGLGIAISSTATTLTLAIANDLAYRSILYTRAT